MSVQMEAHTSTHTRGHDHTISAGKKKKKNTEKEVGRPNYWQQAADQCALESGGQPITSSCSPPPPPGTSCDGDSETNEVPAAARRLMFS